MKDFLKNNQSHEYNTAIKDIAGIADYGVIYEIINNYADRTVGSRPIKMSEEDISIRTSRARTKISWAVNKAILQFLNKDHQDLINSVFRDNVPEQDKKFALFWHFCLTNKLFREISVGAFTKIYFSGRAQISKDDIIAFVRDLMINTQNSNPKWSEDTIYRIATKYLSLMTKFDFVSEGRIKSIKKIHITNEAFVIFLYFSNLCSPNSGNLYENLLLPTCFTAVEEIQNKLKKISLKGLFNMSFDGIRLKIELPFSYKEICNVIYC